MSAQGAGEAGASPESPRSAKGGVAFEIVMEPAKEAPPAALQAESVQPASPTTLEDIQKKLKEAEDRRQSIEAHKLERIHNEQVKIADAQRTIEQAEERKREEQAAALARELEGSAKRREQHISELEQKLKKEEEHAEHVRQKRASMRVEGAAADAPSEPPAEK